MRVCIVADDLTGAMDAAVPFADLGSGTSVAMDADAGAKLAAGETAVVSVDVHSRDAPAAKAAGAVRDAMRRLVACGRLPFKKIDSTLRGHVGAETIAALEGSRRRRAIVCPAAPLLGRRLRGGRLFVDGKAVVPDDLVETLRAQLPDVPVRRLPAGEAVEFTGQPWRLLVADAEDDAHLDYLVDVALARPEDVLLVGSSGLAASLARRAHLVDSATPAQSAARCQRVLFVVGSRNPKSVAQARALLCVDGVADFGVSLNEGPGQSFRFLGEPDARVGIVHVKGLENAPSSDPSLTARRLAEVAASLVVGDAISEVGIVMTGGDTARAALERLGVQVLSISRSLAPGVVLARAATLSGQSLSIVTKAGGFGQDDSFISIAAYLLEGT